MSQNIRSIKKYAGVPEFHEERVAVTNALIKENGITHLVDYGYNPYIYKDFDLPREAITVIERRPVFIKSPVVIHGDFNSLAPQYIQENTLYTYFIFSIFNRKQLKKFINNEFKENNILLVWDRRMGQKYETIRLG